MKSDDMNRNMRYVNRWILVFVCLAVLVVTSCQEQQIPPASQAFIDQHFSHVNIVLVELDHDDDGMEYSVWFNDGMRVDFDETGEWKRISRKKTGVPAALIPPAIARYAKEQYPEEAIFKLSKKTYGYKIELSNEIVVKFDPQFQFLSAED